VSRVRVEKRIAVDASPTAVWEFISEPDNYQLFMAGITRWEVEGSRRRGAGARYAMRMRIGSAEIGGLIEVVEFDEPLELAWTGITGIDQRGRWRLREREDGGTDVTLRLGYHAEGGLLGTLAERVAAPIVGANLRRSLEELKRRLGKRRTGVRVA
jgi:carbon monoxide dehydrogenase subunit G